MLLASGVKYLRIHPMSPCRSDEELVLTGDE